MVKYGVCEFCEVTYQFFFFAKDSFEMKSAK